MNKGKHTHPLLELRNVTVTLQRATVLDNVSLTIPGGENIAIIGPNGSGKSSLINVITRRWYPRAEFSPVVRVFGEEVWDVFDLRSRLGIVSDSLQQECAQELTGRETVLSGFFGSIGLFSNHHVTPRMEEKVREVLEFLEVPHLASKYMTRMSSGEARHILIARALVHDPKALLLDEPANNLDLHAAYRFKNVLRKIARSGKSIILVTHHLHDIIPEIGRVVLLKKGKIFEDGDKKEVLTAKNLTEVFGIPVSVHVKDGYYHAW